MQFRAYTSNMRARVLVLTASLPNVAVRNGASHVWIDVAFEGEWKGHPEGPFELTRDIFEKIVENFESNPNEIPLDYEHASEQPDLFFAPAAGWIQKMEIRDDATGVSHLWIHVALTDKAANQIKAGEYKYSSGVFDFKAVDFISGERIGVEVPSVALTNKPFIRGAESIRLSASRLFTSKGSNMKIAKKQLLALLKTIEGEEVSPEELDALIALAVAQAGGQPEEEEAESVEAAADNEDEEDKDKKKVEASVAAAAPEDEAPIEEAPSEASLEDLLPLAEMAGLSTEELIAALLARAEEIAALLAGAPGAEQEPAADVALSTRALKATQHTIRALNAKVKTLEAFKSLADAKEADDAVDILLQGGQILDDARDDFRKLYLSDRATFTRITASLRGKVPVGDHASLSAPSTKNTPAINEDDEEVKGLRRWLTSARIPRAKQDEQIRERLALRDSR